MQHRLHRLMLEHALKVGHSITAAEVVENTGITRQTVYYWLSNKRLARIDTDTAEKLCAYFDVGPGELFELVD